MRKLIIFLLLLLISTAGAFSGVKPPLGRQVNWSHPLSKGLVGYWLMNEGSGSIVQDLTGNNARGVLSNASWSPGKFGPAVLFDGSSTYFEVPVAKEALFDTPGDFTVLVWMRPNGSQTRYASVAHKSGGNAGNYGWYFDFYLNDALRFGYKTTVYHECFSANNAVVPGQWQQYAGVCENDVLKINIDGVQEADTQALSDARTVNNSAFQIGKSTPDENVWFDGKVSHAMFFQRALSVSELAQLYREPFSMLVPTFNYFLYGGIAVPTVGGQVIFVNIN